MRKSNVRAPEHPNIRACVRVHHARRACKEKKKRGEAGFGRFFSATDYLSSISTTLFLSFHSSTHKKK
jgi:hypothetical protein